MATGAALGDLPAAAAVDDNTATANNANSNFSFANAEHLDRLEASEQVTDIASFQDIDLPPPDVNAAAAGDVNYNYNGNSGNHPDGVRRAKRFYYCLPMMQQYKYMILAALSVFILIVVAMSLTATAARESKQANIMAQQEMAHTNTNNHHAGGSGAIINDAPPSSSWSSPTDTTGEEDPHDEEVGDATESEMTDDGTQPPRETPFPTTAYHLQQIPNHAPSPSSPSSSTGANSSPSSSTSSLSSSSSSTNDTNKPKWFTTNHEQYKSILMSHQTYGAELHSHIIAQLFCRQIDMRLCTYSEYCPDDDGEAPYEGIHDGSHLGWDVSQAEQWSPFAVSDGADDDGNGTSDFDEGMDWVQVGTVPEYEDGTFDNGYGRCWTYMAWKNADMNSGLDIEDTIETNHRRWILCCNQQ